MILKCNVCGQEYDTEKTRWPEERCWEWIEDSLKWRGMILHGDHIHWCCEWDGLPVDETTPEHDCCKCFE